MSIDWSTAPEGATHWEPRSYDFAEGWMRKDWDGWSYWSEGREVWVRGVLTCDVSAEREATFEARPQDTWDGQGLPPVGTEVEANFPVTDTTGTHYHWRRVIVAVAGIPGAERECLVYDAENTKPAWVDELRPIRTPEQIAADERRKSILHLANLLIDSRGQCNEYSQAEAIFDAGYRRQESST